MHSSGQNNTGLSFRQAVLKWYKTEFVTPGNCAHKVKIDKRTAKSRFDEIEPREPSLDEIERAVAGRWASFKAEVLEPVFETPEHLLEAKIYELQQDLARVQAARLAGRIGASGVDRTPKD